jgi:hypothetical protein
MLSDTAAHGKWKRLPGGAAAKAEKIYLSARDTARWVTARVTCSTISKAYCVPSCIGTPNDQRILRMWEKRHQKVGIA